MDHLSHHWFPTWTFITHPLLLLQPTPSFLHPEYNARIRGISNSMSFRSEHHRSYSFSGLSPSRSPISPSVLHSLLFSFYISVILFCILPGSFFFFWSGKIKRSIASWMYAGKYNKPLKHFVRMIIRNQILFLSLLLGSQHKVIKNITFWSITSKPYCM